jgi:hypothetical protein
MFSGTRGEIRYFFVVASMVVMEVSSRIGELAMVVKSRKLTL